MRCSNWQQGWIGMAFENTDARQASMLRVMNLRHNLKQIYSIGVLVQGVLADYQSNADPVMKSTADEMFEPAELAELGQMLTEINGLVSSWTANHPSVLGL